MSLRCHLFGHARDPMRATLADGRPELARAESLAQAQREHDANDARKDQQLADVLDELRAQKMRPVTPFRRRA